MAGVLVPRLEAGGYGPVRTRTSRTLTEDIEDGFEDYQGNADCCFWFASFLQQ